MIASILLQPSFLILTITFNCLEATNVNLFYSVQLFFEFNFVYSLLCSINIYVNESVTKYFVGTRTKTPIKSGLKPSYDTCSMKVF